MARRAKSAPSKVDSCQNISFTHLSLPCPLEGWDWVRLIFVKELTKVLRSSDFCIVFKASKSLDFRYPKKHSVFSNFFYNRLQRVGTRKMWSSLINCPRTSCYSIATLFSSFPWELRVKWSKTTSPLTWVPDSATREWIANWDKEEHSSQLPSEWCVS